MSFEQLNVIAPILRALKQEGYETPTPIQQQAIPILLEGRDLLGIAQTGTGKTAAFAIPILQMLSARKEAQGNPKRRNLRALILTPTRELACQIGDSFAVYGKQLPLRHTCVFGGVSQFGQVQAMSKGVDILVATPGRLLDLIGQHYISLHDIDFFVLDEADRMLDMGFVTDVRKIINFLPQKRQTLFFSATMPKEIQKLADELLSDPVTVEVTPVSSTVEKVQQSLFYVDKTNKKDLLVHLLTDSKIRSVLVFTKTKHTADRVTKSLNTIGIRTEALHGNKSQSARQTALKNFKTGRNRVLVATDIAARGIDIDNITHVINYELPNVPETYVHRIGRTGRAGASGEAFSFCETEERPLLKDIQKLIKKQLDVVSEHPYALKSAELQAVKWSDKVMPSSRRQTVPTGEFTPRAQRSKSRWFNRNGGRRKNDA